MKYKELGQLYLKLHLYSFGIKLLKIIGNVGVESRFYEIALLSRWRDGKFCALQTSFLKQDDLLGAFIYKPNKTTFTKLLNGGTFEANSTKTKIAFDKY